MSSNSGGRRVYQGYPRLGERPSAHNPYPTMADGMRALEQKGRHTNEQVRGPLSEDVPSAAMAGLKPVQQTWSPGPYRGRDEMLGFMEAANAPVVRFNELLRKADPRGIVTNTNPVGVVLGEWADAAQKASEARRKQGYLPGEFGQHLGQLNSGVMLSPLSGDGPGLKGVLKGSAISAALGKSDSFPGNYLDDGASWLGRLEDHLPSWLDFRQQDRPTTRFPTAMKQTRRYR